MKFLLNNVGYFFKEAKTTIKVYMMSNILSILSTGLILFFAAIILSCWWISSEAVEALQNEAEINVYYAEDMDEISIENMINTIEELYGVGEARLVSEDEAYKRMEEILGKEAKVLKYLDENPFNSFIELSINLEEMESVIESLRNIDGIDQIRDNREVLEKLRSITSLLETFGYIFIAAVGASTLIIVSHIIRAGIFDNREQIKTLRLLGAPEMFISAPFLIEGLILTISGGLLAIFMSAFSVKYIYTAVTGPLPFIPLPPLEPLIRNLIIMIISLSIAFGILGSSLGLWSARDKQTH